MDDDEWNEIVKKSETLTLEICDSEEHRRDVEAVIKKHAVKPVELKIVDDIAAWCAATGISISGNPNAAVVPVPPNGDLAILLRRRIDLGRVKNDFSTLSRYGFQRAIFWLDTPEKFLEHLVLHEVAHVNFGWDHRKRPWRCDEWAFKKMGMI